MARGQTTQVKLGRAEVTTVITAHVAQMFRNPVEVTNVEMHREGGATVTYKTVEATPALPLGEGDGTGQAKTGDS